MAVFNLTKEQAKILLGYKWWKECLNKEIVAFQMFCNEEVVPFGVYMEAVEDCLGKIDLHKEAEKKNKFEYLKRYDVRIPLKLMLILDDMLVQ